MVTSRGAGDDAATGDYFYHTHDHLPPSPRLRRDWRGSTRNVYAQNKDDAAAFEYTPYGRELFATNRALTTRGYTGHTRESALGGAYYAPFRYYLPNLARWEKRDPLGMVDGPNVYAYVRGNVVGMFDFLGLVSEEQCELMSKLRDCEERWGTRLCALDFSNTYPYAKNPPGELTNNKPFPTQYGKLDLDWFIDLNILRAPIRIFNWTSADPNYIFFKSLWKAVMATQGEKVLWPYQDEKERATLRQVRRGRQFRDLFPDDFMAEHCDKNAACS